MLSQERLKVKPSQQLHFLGFDLMFSPLRGEGLYRFNQFVGSKNPVRCELRSMVKKIRHFIFRHGLINLDLMISSDDPWWWQQRGCLIKWRYDSFIYWHPFCSMLIIIAVSAKKSDLQGRATKNKSCHTKRKGWRRWCSPSCMMIICDHSNFQEK